MVENFTSTMASIVPFAILKGHEEDRIWHLSWSKDGKYLASSGEDKVIRIWKFGMNDVESNVSTSYDISCISTLEDGQSRTIRCCEWSNSGNMIASASFDGTVFLWAALSKDKRKWEKIASLEGHDNEVKSVTWNSSDDRLATCGRDKKIWVWEILPGGEFECVAVLEGHTQDVKFLAWHPNLAIMFSCSYDDTIRVWREEDEDEWVCSQVLTGHKSTVWGLTFDQSGCEMISCSDDKSLILWRAVATGAEQEYMSVATLTGSHSGPIYSVHRRENLVLTAGGDNAISLCSATDDGLLQSLLTYNNAHEADVNCIRWRPCAIDSTDQLIFATAGDDGLVKLWKVSLH